MQEITLKQTNCSADSLAQKLVLLYCVCLLLSSPSLPPSERISEELGFYRLCREGMKRIGDSDSSLTAALLQD